MTRSELVESLSNHLVQPTSTVEAVVDTVFAQMREALVEGGRVEIRGFGSFQTKDYPAYQGRNPRTGRPLDVAEKRLPVFRAGKELRERLEQEPLSPMTEPNP